LGKLDGKVTLATGGNSGIGFATTPRGGLANPKEAKLSPLTLGDRAEATAIRSAFDKDAARLRVSSTKSMTGHLLGAAGSLEAGITVLALRDQIAPPTTNLVETDEEMGLDLILSVGSPADIECAMTNSFGFGGTNASLIFRRLS
jgi:3-oxoacyl-[acyl-carrier-protein] synthase II